MTGPLIGSCAVPGDKSISHRAAILGALAVGTSRVRGFSASADCASTLGAVASLEVPIERTTGGEVLIRGPVDDVRRDVGTVDCGRAGTAMRLLAGVLASLPV